MTLSSVFKPAKRQKDPDSPLIKKSFFQKHKFILLSFFTPFTIMLFAFACAGFYPFGDNQILMIDMWHQYFQFFKLQHDALTSGGSLLYTWNSALGTNMFNLTYYIASPLNFLCVFVPTEYLTEAFAMLVIIKSAFAGAFMAIYLRSMFKKCNFGTAAFATLYALCAYAVGYYWCLMWLDVMALLPLCILGLNKLIDEGKYKLYAISLAIMMISNYYIGVMVCMFIAIYYPILYFSRKGQGFKHFAVTTGKAVLFSAVGVGMAAIVLIPTYLGMQYTYYIDQAAPLTTTFYQDILDILSNLLPNVTITFKDTETNSLPNIYCGLLTVMMAIMYLFLKSIPARKRILNCVILGLLLLSFNVNKINFVWHGFHFPNELPWRFSFCFSFILLTMAYEAFTKLDEITPRMIGCVAGGGFLFLIIWEKFLNDIYADYADKYVDRVIYLSLFLLFAYSIILAIHKTHRFKETLTGVLIFLFVFGEISNYAVAVVTDNRNNPKLYTEGSGQHKSSRTTFFTAYDDITGLVEDVAKEDDGFYRTEIGVNKWTSNDSALYGYKGMSVFSSQLNSNLSSAIKSLGFAADPGSNAFSYHVTTPLLNAMLNMKYIIGKSTTIDDFALELKHTRGGSNIYENQYPLSIAYMVDDDISSWSLNNGDPFSVQNDFAWSATGISMPLFNMINCDSGTADGAVISDIGSNIINTSGSTIQLVYTSPTTQPVYAYVSATGANSITARRENGQTMTYEAGRGSIISLGTAQAGEKIYVNINLENSGSTTINAYVYGLDEKVWEDVYAVLNAGALQVTDYSDTRITGTVSAQNDGILMTSIPYEKGWSVKVDGEKIETMSVQNAFVAIPLTAGNHEVEFSFIPDGFILGVCISIISIAALVAAHYVFQMLEKRRVAAATAAALPDSDTASTDAYFDFPEISENTDQSEQPSADIDTDDSTALPADPPENDVNGQLDPETDDRAE